MSRTKVGGTYPILPLKLLPDLRQVVRSYQESDHDKSGAFNRVVEIIQRSGNVLSESDCIAIKTLVETLWGSARADYYGSDELPDSHLFQSLLALQTYYSFDIDQEPRGFD